MIVFIDTNILGLISNENTSFDEAQQCKKWFSTLLIRSVRVVTSDLCNYEEMRGLLSSSILKKEVAPGIKSLEFLRADGFLEFLPVSTEALDLAAKLWARASTSGQTTRDEKDIDIDIIISAQYQLLRNEFPGQQVIMATTNLKHLSIFCEAAHWRDIKL
jgi:predicted nucleic acid-binding protein